MRKIHFLKTVEPYFSAVLAGRKTFEVRFNDRGFQVDDLLLLYSLTSTKYTLYKVTYVLDSEQYLQSGYVALGMSRIGDIGQVSPESSLVFQSISIPIEDVTCSSCKRKHFDIGEWAVKPHKTHLCRHCGTEFEGTVKGVSRPIL
jgi:Domain of unknown function (DUF3850)